MDHDAAPGMAEALRLTRAGRLSDATAVMQRALGLPQSRGFSPGSLPTAPRPSAPRSGRRSARSGTS